MDHQICPTIAGNAHPKDVLAVEVDLSVVVGAARQATVLERSLLDTGIHRRLVEHLCVAAVGGGHPCGVGDHDDVEQHHGDDHHGLPLTGAEAAGAPTHGPEAICP